jgi:hypothetical protein
MCKSKDSKVSGKVSLQTKKSPNGAGYLEYIAKTHKSPQKEQPKKEPQYIVDEEFRLNFGTYKEVEDTQVNANSWCIRKIAKGYTLDTGTQVFKPIYCNKENCSYCGADGSIPHRRKVGRWLPKAFQCEKLGYLVFTIPYQLRKKMMDPEMLNKVQTYTKRLLSESYKVPHGLSRWHWAGEDGITWKPHLNILIDRGYLAKPKLLKLRALYTAYINSLFNTKFPVINIYYAYTKETAKKLHRVKYVTRATYKGKNPEILKCIKGYRNNRTWGKYDKEVGLQKMQDFYNSRTEEQRTDNLKAYIDHAKQKIHWDGFLTPKGFNLLFERSVMVYLGFGTYELISENKPVPE